MIGTFLPEACAVEIGLGDAVQGESGDFDEEFDDEERDDYPWGLPFPWDGSEAVFDTHRVVRAVKDSIWDLSGGGEARRWPLLRKVMIQEGGGRDVGSVARRCQLLSLS